MQLALCKTGYLELDFICDFVERLFTDLYLKLRFMLYRSHKPRSLRITARTFR